MRCGFSAETGLVLALKEASMTLVGFADCGCPRSLVGFSVCWGVNPWAMPKRAAVVLTRV